MESAIVFLNIGNTENGQGNLARFTLHVQINEHFDDLSFPIIQICFCPMLGNKPVSERDVQFCRIHSTDAESAQIRHLIRY